MLTGLLDHETFRAARVGLRGSWRAKRGLTVLSAQITDVPGQTLTFPMMLAASGVKYLASGPIPSAPCHCFRPAAPKAILPAAVLLGGA